MSETRITFCKTTTLLVQKKTFLALQLYLRVKIAYKKNLQRYKICQNYGPFKYTTVSWHNLKTTLKCSCTAFRRSSDCCHSVMTCIPERKIWSQNWNTLKPKMNTSPESSVENSNRTETKLPRWASLLTSITLNKQNPELSLWQLPGELGSVEEQKYHETLCKYNIRPLTFLDNNSKYYQPRQNPPLQHISPSFCCSGITSWYSGSQKGVLVLFFCSSVWIIDTSTQKCPKQSKRMLE